MQVQRRDAGIVSTIRNPAPEGDGWSAQRPGRLYPEKDPVPIVQGAGWASETVWTARIISLPLEFDPRTNQPIASR